MLSSLVEPWIKKYAQLQTGRIFKKIFLDNLYKYAALIKRKPLRANNNKYEMKSLSKVIMHR